MLTLSPERLTSTIRGIYTLTHIRMVLFDLEGNEIFSYPEKRCELCVAIRSDPLREARCHGCDQRAFRQCRDNREPMIYRCHAGLTETVISLKEKDVLLGYFMIGQVLCGQDEAVERERIRNWLQSEGMTGVEQEMARVPWKTPEEMKACATILKLLTAYLLSNKLVELPQAAFLERLHHYLDTHMDSTISVKELSQYFGISRSALYQLTTRQLGCGLGTYIRRYRIRTACRLLEDTKDSIGDIAGRVGFLDQNNFSRVFRTQMHMTPSEYRRQMAGRQGDTGKRQAESR